MLKLMVLYEKKKEQKVTVLLPTTFEVKQRRR